MKTISVHNGKTYNRKHNIRDEYITENQGHIKKHLKDLNVIFYDEPIEKAYKRIFGNALKEYNEKREPNRQIKSYLQHIRKDKVKNEAYEVIVQIGNMQDSNINNFENLQVEQRCLQQYYNSWAERNPHLEIIGAYLHNDENTPHLHVTYIPIGTGFKKGLSIQNSLKRALLLQGFETKGKKTAQMQWQEAERDALREICINHNIEVAPPKNEKRQHLETELYKTLSRTNELKKEEKQLERNIMQKHHDLEKIKEKYSYNKEHLEEILANSKSRFNRHTLTDDEYAQLKSTIYLVDEYERERDYVLEQKYILREERERLAAEKKSIQQIKNETMERYHDILDIQREQNNFKDRLMYKCVKKIKEIHEQYRDDILNVYDYIQHYEFEDGTTVYDDYLEYRGEDIDIDSELEEKAISNEEELRRIFDELDL